MKHCWIFSIVVSLLWSAPAFAAKVRPLFNLEDRKEAPFPTDRFTVKDESHKTGLRVNLPLPNCVERPSDCNDIEVINTLDGFNLQPRLSIPFDGPIKVESVTSRAIFLIRLRSDDHDDDRYAWGGDDDDDSEHDGKTPSGDRHRLQAIGIDQIVWDPTTNTLHVESDELLEQHTRYALIVTNRLRDWAGEAVEAAREFRRFRQSVRGRYKQALLDAVRSARQMGVDEDDIVAASVFTTQSVTAVLEKIRDQIKATNPAPADFLLAPGGTRSVFWLNDITGMTFNRHLRVNPDAFDSVPLALGYLRMFPGGIEKIAFGKFSSPDYQVHPGEFIPPVGTRTGIPQRQGTIESYFDLYLPSGPKPAAGWPVAIYGVPAGTKHIPLIAPMMATKGIATIVIDTVGSGFGPLGSVTITQTGSSSVIVASGGRARDQNGDGVFGTPTIAPEGNIAAEPKTWTIHMRDAMRQTVVELMQLVRQIEVGMDVDGDGFRDVDPSRIYFTGPSLGGMFGTLFVAVEPNVRAAVFNVPTGWSPVYGRFNIVTRVRDAAQLQAGVPGLLNAPGVSSIEGVPFAGPQRYNENLPLRDGVPLNVGLENGTTHIVQSPVINMVPGAIELQEVFEIAEWARQSADPPAYARHLRQEPLRGMRRKSVLFQFVKGDMQAVNPGGTAIVRAGDLADRTLYYRHDIAFAENSGFPKNPHGFIGASANPNQLIAAIARGALEQIAVFFASDGRNVIHPEPARLFEVPLAGPLPEGLNFIP